MKPSCACVLLIVIVLVATTAQAPAPPAMQEAICDRLNTEVYGADGRTGFTLTYRQLRGEITYLDQLISRAQQRQALDLQRSQQAQAQYPGAKVRNLDLQADRHFETVFGSLRQQAATELNGIAATIAARRNELQRRGCQERVDPQSGSIVSAPMVPGEGGLCYETRIRLLSLRDDLAVRKRAINVMTIIHNVFDEMQGAIRAATGQTSADIAAQLQNHDAGLDQMRNTERGEESMMMRQFNDGLRLARSFCPQLLALFPSVPQSRATAAPLVAVQAVPRSIAGNWQARGDPRPDSPAYSARINDVDANGEYWGVIYKDPQWPIHFHGKFQGATMPYAWYGRDSKGQGTLTYQDANHVVATWRDTGSGSGSGTWYLSR